MQTRRSVVVAIAITLQQLISGKVVGWSDDQVLVIEALRRSNSALANASQQEIGAYLRALQPEQMNGVAANTKGILHEILFARAENLDGDAISAQLFQAANQPGADVEFLVDGDVIGEVQLKAVQDPAAIIEHFARYPDIDVAATSEVYAVIGPSFSGRLTDSGVSNDEITAMTRTVLDELANEDLTGFIQDGVVTSLLVSGAIQARAVLQGQSFDINKVRSTLELAGIGAGTAFTVDFLLNSI